MHYNAEKDDDLDDLRSLIGSDDEVDTYLELNPSSNFSKPIQLTLSLKFPSNEV